LGGEHHQLFTESMGAKLTSTTVHHVRFNFDEPVACVARARGAGQVVVQHKLIGTVLVDGDGSVVRVREGIGLIKPLLDGVEASLKCLQLPGLLRLEVLDSVRDGDVGMADGAFVRILVLGVDVPLGEQIRRQLHEILANAFSAEAAGKGALVS
jgi:hypothetical protein